ncbi:MAG: NAD-dependent epimerase/dehydratase family protein [Methylocystaceae bacterium]|nr:NAD-dependent epimerase/dehydratase family protein [Methylocystaceae bacterium]
MPLSSPTILVTGANGFIGHHVVEELRTQGETVLCIGHSDVDLAEATYPLPDTIQTIYHFARQNLEVSYRVADITKLTSLSGWKPTVFLTDGLARVVAEMG